MFYETFGALVPPLLLLFDEVVAADFFGRPRFRTVPSLLALIFGFERIALPTFAALAGRPRFFFVELSFAFTAEPTRRPRLFFVASAVEFTVEF